MQDVGTILIALYLTTIGVMCIYGLHRYWMVWTYWQTRHTHSTDSETLKFSHLPRVTIQLPMFNERRVAERIINAACAVEYPRDRLQIQVLDDSTDESAEIAKQCCERMSSRGYDIHYLHRNNRNGYKAGALANGLKSATGEFIAVFDADFVPPTTFLQQTIHHFTNARVGMVQTRWSHLNRDDSLLTQIQAMFLDGHFVIEQAARAATGRWFNFNGTAGIWRRATIEDAGGWQHDTLTEDTDLSYRAQLSGWQFLYLSTVMCPAEVPPTISAFLSQQHRWNKGLIQTAMKLLPRILRSDASLKMKVEAWFHLTSPLVHLLILVLALLVILTMFASAPVITSNIFTAFTVGSLFVVLGALAVCTFYVASQQAQRMNTLRTIFLLPILLAIGIGICLVNSKAVVGAIFGKQSPFIRTPKYNGNKISDPDPVVATRRRGVTPGLFETVIGAAMAACSIASLFNPHVIVATPFIVLFACGFLSIGIPQIIEAIFPARISQA